MLDKEYAEANANFRFSLSSEVDFYKFHVQLIAILIGAYWLVAEIQILRLAVCFLGAAMSAIGIVAETRMITYYQHFFDQTVRIEGLAAGKLMTSFREQIKRPFLGIRISNALLFVFSVALLFWTTLFIADLAHMNWFQNVFQEMQHSRAGNGAIR